MIPVGIDIAKEKIDVWHASSLTTLPNAEGAMKKYFRRFKGQEDVRVVMEATGRHHRLAHRILSQMEIPVMVVNPYQSRYFARAMNLQCKTDKADAQVLHDFAGTMRFKATSAPGPVQAKMRDLVRLLEDVSTAMRAMKARQDLAGAFEAKTLKALVKAHEQQIKKIGAELEKVARQDEAVKRNVGLLVSFPGIGEKTAIMLLALMPELGTLTRRQAASLAGLAPMNHDSGKMQGKRHIRSGRHDLRSHLYMPVLGAATCGKGDLRAVYDRLRAAGKPAKVALTACMRHLVVTANGMLRRQEMWKGANKQGEERARPSIAL